MSNKLIGILLIVVSVIGIALELAFTSGRLWLAWFGFCIGIGVAMIKKGE